jgi:hypothetical protein
MRKGERNIDKLFDAWSLEFGAWPLVIGCCLLVIGQLSLFFRLRTSDFPLFSSVIGLRSPVSGHRSSVIGLFLILGLSLSLSSQESPYLYQVNQYNFIRYDLNEMIHFGEDSYSSGFYDKLEKLLSTGEGNINIVQIGGSHIQAGSFSGQIRTRLQQMNGDMNAGWGYMFPYRMARTNSPYGYYIRYTGNWESCRNVETRKSCSLGVGGISATTFSPKAELTVLLEDENTIDYRFNKIRVFYKNEESNYSVSIDSSILKKAIKTDSYYDFEFNQHVDSLKIIIEKEPDTQGSFTLFGLNASSAPNGITYHSIGINGAKVPSFLRCDSFEEQLEMLKPDLVILGLGINDAYGKRFSQKNYEENYEMLIGSIRSVAPNADIIFTTNNDSYLYRRYVNKNGEKVKESMLKMAGKLDAGVWNMYNVMGGLNSIVLWQRHGLAQRDKIHFTREGYLIMGDLFFNALIKNFEQYLQTKKQLTANNSENIKKSNSVKTISYGSLTESKLNTK